MSISNHTYGPTCHLGRARTVTFSGANGFDDIPELRAQFFYSSPLPIDDPLSAVPVPTGADSVKHPPRPFSGYDNNALEEAWLGLASEKDRKYHLKRQNTKEEQASKKLVNTKKDKSTNEIQDQRRVTVVSEIAAKHSKKHAKEGDSTRTKNSAKAGAQPASEIVNTVAQASYAQGDPCTPDFDEPTRAEIQNVTDRKALQEHEISGNPYSSQGEDIHHVALDEPVLICCEELENDLRAENRKGFSGLLKRINSKASEHQKLIQDVMLEQAKLRDSGVNNNEAGPSTKKEDKKAAKKAAKKSKKVSQGRAQGDTADDSNGISAPEEESDNAIDESKTKTHKLFERHLKPKVHKDVEMYKETDESDQSSRPNSSKAADAPYGSSPAAHNTTGFPFLRAPSRRGKIGSRSRSRSPDPSIHDSAQESDAGNISDNLVEEIPVPIHHEKDDKISTHSVHKSSKTILEVPVGVSRLHLVKLPALQMMPIYWSPIHDIAEVTRGTWFYKDSMLPVEPAVANQLEMGYRELRPWSQTWGDELNSAIEVGAIGEEKISHKLWPTEIDHKLQAKHGLLHETLSSEPGCAARCFHGEAAAVGVVEMIDENSPKPWEGPKRYLNHEVIYKDAQNAFVLKSNLQPSAYYGRKPLAKIKKGTTVGIHVVRGFDWKAWEKLHPSKKSATTVKTEQAAPVSGDADASKENQCSACRDQENRPKVTDLILVIHGIGQKLSERVESFHFTHAINSFRRSVNVELGNEAVHNVLRPELGGMMVLPVNWRSGLSFEEGGPMKADDYSKMAAKDNFTLKDITPGTIPAVRNLISDVMLDIPFYMSHHKPKMIAALINEANRVYRLWCKNNPEFQEQGRVHVIAHSLGSAMALDVLSKQPTSVKPGDVTSKKIRSKHFDFDTKNLFFVGSPAGFFLLLEKGKLVPRKARNKPDAEDSDDKGKSTTSDAGTFGSLAVDNIYNVMHYNDPIAYRLNATVDPAYASSLKSAQVPSATTGFFESIGNAMRSITPGVTPSADLAVGQVAKPTALARMPSTLEMEVHDFTREEIAEKKFYLLNDNGQVDWFLSSGGGPLEIQYLNMLGAHSSYWESKDFIRMLVLECGRQPGRKNTLPNMRAVKETRKQIKSSE